jgi:uncharacterized membrane protein
MSGLQCLRPSRQRVGKTFPSRLTRANSIQTDAMPYKWIEKTGSDDREMHLWPHQSLSPKGFAIFISATFLLILLPLFLLLGSVALWGILPFLLLTVGGIWLALGRSRHNAQIIEVLTIGGKTAHLIRQDQNATVREWACNRYWARPMLHPKGGPVPYYVTLTGAGREVEIGAFLSEDERKALFDDLMRAFHHG